jgi:hypothetical protein
MFDILDGMCSKFPENGLEWGLVFIWLLNLILDSQYPAEALVLRTGLP